MTEVMDRDNAPGYRELPFCITPTTQLIFDAVTRCITCQVVKLGRITGAPGTGKTTALREFAQITPGVQMVTMTPAHATPRVALGHILNAFGYASPRATWQAADDLQDILRRHQYRALIIDEAQQSYVGLSDLLRSISDRIGIAVVFCGNPKYLSLFGKDQAAFAQITSRLAVDLKLGKPALGDVMAICELLGVRDQAARSLLFKCSQSHGALRMVHNLVNISESLAGSASAIRTAHIKDALAVIGGVS